MGSPVILPREAHAISQQEIDSDALKVLYRLQKFNYLAYLVGGSVRDLLLGRRPKDFDIGTSAHPYQIKKLFRNCWIIGRRFRLAHVRFGTKTIEVATFRRQIKTEVSKQTGESTANTKIVPLGDSLIRRDNTFGTPKEDAFRRDFTVNALFYNVADRSVIDYTNGLSDLEARIIRSIGDPNERFQEDPVRMTRAVALAARLDFTIDLPIERAISKHRSEIARSAPPRLLEELYKILRTGYSEKTFKMLAERRLLEPIAPTLQRATNASLWRSLKLLDTYRKRFIDTPETLTNALLLASLLLPLGHTIKTLTSMTSLGKVKPPKQPLSLGMLPIARRDVERLRQILIMQHKLLDTNISTRASQALIHRKQFHEAVTWLEISGEHPELVERWSKLLKKPGRPKKKYFRKNRKQRQQSTAPRSRKR